MDEYVRSHHLCRFVPICSCEIEARPSGETVPHRAECWDTHLASKTQGAFSMVSFPAPNMNNVRLGRLISALAESVEGEPGFWQFQYKRRRLMAITNEDLNRMRLLTPILPESEFTDSIRKFLLSANFDRALDARYATSRGMLWSVFLHPLRELTDGQFTDAVEQVHKLAENFGTTYSSSDLPFEEEV